MRTVIVHRWNLSELELELNGSVNFRELRQRNSDWILIRIRSEMIEIAAASGVVTCAMISIVFGHATYTAISIVFGYNSVEND